MGSFVDSRPVHPFLFLHMSIQPELWGAWEELGWYTLCLCPHVVWTGESCPAPCIVDCLRWWFVCVLLSVSWLWVWSCCSPYSLLMPFKRDNSSLASWAWAYRCLLAFSSHVRRDKVSRCIHMQLSISVSLCFSWRFKKTLSLCGGLGFRLFPALMSPWVPDVLGVGKLAEELVS